LPGSITFDPIVPLPVAGRSRLASDIVWFDALVTNVDRTAKNTNLLVWHRKLWMIDHGATLIFQHQWESYRERSRAPFAPIRDHVLLAWADEIREADARLSATLTEEVIDQVLAMIAEPWLEDGPSRAVYRDYLMERLQEPREWMEEAVRARALRV
ncbi:MAG TPA: HipA family kinase, partial [Thermoanaerobaculia bacterium]